MVNGDGRVWNPSDPERFHARFRAWYQMLNIAELGRKTKVGAEDLKAYAQEHPVEAQKVQKLQTISRISSASAVLGFVGATSQIWRWSKTAPLVITGAVIAPVTAFLVVEDVASLVLGTFKFDNHKATEDYLTWANTRNENMTKQ